MFTKIKQRAFIESLLGSQCLPFVTQPLEPVPETKSTLVDVEFLINGTRWTAEQQSVGVYKVGRPVKPITMGDPAPRVLTPENFAAEITKLDSVEIWQDGTERGTYKGRLLTDRNEIYLAVHHGKELGQELRNYKWKEGE